MKRLAGFIKKYWKNFDDSLINPPKPRTETKDFKGQLKPQKPIGEGPGVTAEQILARNRIME